MIRQLSSFALRFSVLSFSFLSGIAALFGANLYFAFSAEVREEAVTIRAAKRGNPWINFQDGRGSSAQIFDARRDECVHSSAETS